MPLEGQFEIREAIAMSKPMVLLHEVSVRWPAGTQARHDCRAHACAQADARYGAFDFHGAYSEAPPDLKQLLDSHESLPFRCVRALSLFWQRADSCTCS